MNEKRKTALTVPKRMHQGKTERRWRSAGSTGRLSTYCYRRHLRTEQRRMAESTGFQNAKTLHSALGLISGDEDKSHLNKKEMIDADLIVIDEISMVDMWLALQLFTRLRDGTKVLLIGDPDQLPSVGAGNVFRELITCGLIPVTELVQIFRQSSESSIPFNAKLINQGIRKLHMNTNDFIFKEHEVPTDVPPVIHQIYLDEVGRTGLENYRVIAYDFHI